MSAAIASTSRTIQQYLLAALQADPVLAPLFLPVGMATVSLASPDGMADLGETGVSVWLYRFVRDEQTLNRPARRRPPDMIEHVPLPIRLHYLVTPLMAGNGGAPAPDTDQQLLGLILRTFHDRPILSGATLAGSLLGTDHEIAVRQVTPSLEEIARIWDTLNEPYRISVCYEIGLADIESALPDGYGPAVTISQPTFGSAELAP